MRKHRIRKSVWGAVWRLHDEKKRFAARLKKRLEALPPRTRKKIVLAMLAVFALLALYTFGKAVYDIGRDNGREVKIGHIRRLELPRTDKNNVIRYQDGNAEE